MDALMRTMRQTHHDAMNTSMFDAEAYDEASGGSCPFPEVVRRTLETSWRGGVDRVEREG
jgi:hypothetical protein